MRVVRFFLILLLCFSSSLSLAAFAADLKIKVVDPQGAAVSGAASVARNYGRRRTGARCAKYCWRWNGDVRRGHGLGRMSDSGSGAGFCGRDGPSFKAADC